MTAVDPVFSSLREKGEIKNLLDILQPDDFDEFVSGLLIKLQSLCKEIAFQADKFYFQGEESISAVLAMLLEQAGYRAKQEPAIRGHIDILVEKDGFRWIIEAKIGYSNSKILEGLLQLSTRYLSDERSACLIIFYKKNKYKEKMRKWRQYIDNESWRNYAKQYNFQAEAEQYLKDTKTYDESCCIDPNFVFDVNVNGVDAVKIYNIAINVYFNPLDSSGRKNKELQEQNQVEYLKQTYFDFKDDNSKYDIDKIIKAIEKIYDLS